jgi:hypothetical protein
MATAWVLVTAGILLATGWKRQILDDVPALRAALAAAALAAACGLGTAAAPKLLALACACALLRNADAGKRLQAMGGAVLGGIVWIWIRKLYTADPVFIFWDARLDGPLAAGILAAAAAGHFRSQLPAVTAAAIAADWLDPAPAGAWAWLDGFLVSLFAARTAAMLARGAAALAGRLRPHAGSGAE